MSETETVRDTCEIDKIGRLTIPDKLKEILDLKNKKAYCQIENYGKDKLLITILSRWTPSKRTLGKDVVKNE